MRYIKTVSELRAPDLVILPGTKNTMEDLLWLRQSGLEVAILKLAAQGTPVFGVCGGYQMLGQELRDPLGIEHGGTLKGLGLLPLVTTFSAQKTRTQVSGRTGDLAATALPQLSHRAFSGYEIHMGQTEPCGSSGLCESHRPNKANNSNAFPFGVIERRNGEACAEQQGFCCGNVFGTYIHGIFDQPQMAPGLIEALCLRKGLDPW